MFSVFPELFTFSFLAIGVFRIIVGLVYASLGGAAWRNHKDIFGLAQVVVSIFLVVGLFTQLSVLVLAVLVLWNMWRKEETENMRQLHILLLVSSLLILFIGPGALALDVPF